MKLITNSKIYLDIFVQLFIFGVICRFDDE